MIMATILFLLTGCTHGPGSSQGGSDVKISENVLTWAVPDIYHISQDALTQFNKTLSKKGYDFAVKFVPLNFANYQDELDVYEQENGAFDVVFSGTNSYGSPIDYTYSRIKKGYFTSLEDYLSTSDGKKLYEMFDPKQWESVKMDDRIYTIPNADVEADNMQLVFNKKYINEKELEEFSGDIAELRPFLEKIPISEDFSHLLMSIGFIEYGYPYVDCDFPYYGLLLSHDGKGAHNPFDYAPYRDFLTCYHDYYQKGYMNYEVPVWGGGIDYEEQEKFLNNGNFFMYAAGDAEYITSKGVGTETFTYQIEPIYIHSLLTATTGIPTKSEHKDEAFQLLSLVHTDNELANILVYGEEGVDFKLEDGVAKTMDGSVPGSTQNQYWLGLYGSVSPTANETIVVDRATDRKNYFKDKVKSSPYLGKNFDPTGYEDIITDIYKIYKDNYDIWTRDDIEAEMDRVNQELKAVGIDKLVDAMNEQFGVK